MPSGGQFVGREQKSVTPGNGDAREPRSVGERDQVARERKAAIGKLKRFDARGRGLELGLAGKRIVFRHRQRADARIGRRRIAPVNWRENRSALLTRTNANPKHGAAMGRRDLGETAIGDARPTRIIGVNIDHRFG